MKVYFFLFRPSCQLSVCENFYFYFLFSFIFSILSKVIIIVIDFMFLGINMFSTLLRAHFNPCRAARAKMCLSRTQNMFMPTSINFIV